MGTYYIETTDTEVDGSTFCGGSACTLADTIIIRAGDRGNLLLKNFNGSGSYITITNENVEPGAKVIITTDSTGEAYAGLELRDCKYVDLRGDNDAGLDYGIKVHSDGTPIMAAAIWVRQACDHLKIGYIETSHEGNPSTTSGGGILIQDGTMDNTYIWDTIEIHHNYIHDTRYSGMYLGQNLPLENDNPYIANVHVHDNILEDMGSYGITLKGVHATSGVCSIYNNVIKRTGLVYTDTVGEKRNGIKTHYYYGSTYVNIYGNWIEGTMGAGLVIGNGDHQVYDNILVNCGTGDHAGYGHGIRIEENDNTSNLYDNIIIQPTRYGIMHSWGTGTVNVDRNLIGDPGVGYVEDNPVLVEGTGANANIKHADVADFGFTTWSDDNDYSNDDFTFESTYTLIAASGQYGLTGRIVGLDKSSKIITEPCSFGITGQSVKLTYRPILGQTSPGIEALRATTQYDGDVAYVLTPDGGQIVYTGGQPIMDIGGLENAVNISLFTGAGWWANALNENEPDKQIGSDFEERAKPKAINTAYLRDVEDATMDALQWMINQKIAQTVEAIATWPELNLVDLEILITKPDGDVVILKHELNWESGLFYPVTAKAEGF